MRGYLDDPQLTAAAYDDGWFRTGDLAVELPDGRVGLRGRAKDLIIRGGNKVTPAEVEQAIGSLPAVAAALVAGARSWTSRGNAGCGPRSSGVTRGSPPPGPAPRPIDTPSRVGLGSGAT